MQFIVNQDDFMEKMHEWLLSLEDERMILLRHFIFEIDLSETDQLKDVLYQYGSHLTEKNYVGRKFFEQMAELLRQMELNRQTAAK